MWIILLALLGVVYLAGTIGAVSANFVDTDQSTDNRLIISNWWLQTTRAQFETGVLSNVDTTTSSNNVILSKAYSLVTSNDTIVSQSGTTYTLKKTLTFTKSDTSYDSIQIISQLRSSSTNRTAYIDIRVDDVSKFTHTTTSTSYQTYTDTLDFSSYASGPHTIKCYLKSSKKNDTAYNQYFRLYNYPYVSSGTLASAVYDSTMTSAAWSKLYWTETLASGTDITFEVRASDTSFTKSDGTPTWVSLGSGDSPQTMSVTGRYFQWRATMTTSVGANTPTLSDVTVYYPSTT